MAASTVTYTGDGALKTYNVPFPFISPSHVDVYVNNTLQLDPMDYSLSGSTVTFLSAPGSGDAIVVKRSTSPNAVLVDFVDGSVLNASDLDTAYLHNYYLLQETTDSYNEVVNNALLSVATGTGIVETETDEVIAALVNEMLSDAAAANLQARITDIDNNAQGVLTNVQSILDEVSARAALGARVTTAEGNITTNDSDITALETTVNHGTTGVVANSAAIGVLDTRVTIAEGSISTSASDITALETTVNHGTTGVAANASGLSALDTRVTTAEGNVTTNASDITALEATVNHGTTGVAANASGLSALDTRVTTAEGNITTSASDITALQAEVDLRSTVFRQISAPTANNAGDLWFDSDDGDKLYRWDGAAWTNVQDAVIGATSSALSALDTRVTTAEGTITSEALLVDTLQSEMITAQGDINAAEVTISAHTTAISTAEGDIDTLEAKYGVTLNVNGYITGFAQNNDGTTGTFVVLADKFAIVDPSGDPAETEYVPFSVSGGVVSMQNVEIDGNLVVAGTITNDELGSKAATELVLGTGYTATPVENTWVAVDSVTVTTGANDIVELNSRFSFSCNSSSTIGQCQWRFRRFNGATPVTIIQPVDVGHHNEAASYWYNKLKDVYVTRFEQPGAGTWTYKFEFYVPSAMTGPYSLSDCRTTVKVFKKSG